MFLWYILGYDLMMTEVRDGRFPNSFILMWLLLVICLTCQSVAASICLRSPGPTNVWMDCLPGMLLHCRRRHKNDNMSKDFHPEVTPSYTNSPL